MNNQEKIKRKLLIKKAIFWSLKIKELKDILGDIRNLEINLSKNKFPLRSLVVNKNDINQEINNLKKHVIKNTMPLFYDKLTISSNLKIFAEIDTTSFFEQIKKNTMYNSLDYISTVEMKQGHICLQEVEQHDFEIISKNMILNLSNGRYMEQAEMELDAYQPVDISILLDEIKFLSNR